MGCVQHRLLKLPLHNLSHILHETINIPNAELDMIRYFYIALGLVSPI